MQNTSDGSMARKSWFSLVKKFFISDTVISEHKKQRRRRWFSGRFKIKRKPPFPASSPTRDTEEQSDQNFNVDILMAAAAEEIVADNFDQPSSTSQYTCQREDECREFSSIYHKYSSAPTSTPHWRREIHQLAATKIQKAFRGYLARKLFWALKGIVRLQATIRGILARRQAIATLNKLQSVVNIQAQVRAKRSQMLDGSSCSQGNKEVVMDFKGKGIKRSEELEQNKIDGRWRWWLEQCVDTRISKTEDPQNLVSIFSTRERIKKYKPGVELLKSRNLHKQCHWKESESPVTSSFHHLKQHSSGNRCSAGGGSPGVPTYMAATESTKAKVRSISSPRLRPMSFNSNSEIFSPYKHKLSPISSMSMVTTPSNGYSYRSPYLKGPIISNRYSKFLSIN